MRARALFQLAGLYSLKPRCTSEYGSSSPPMRLG